MSIDSKYIELTADVFRVFFSMVFSLEPACKDEYMDPKLIELTANVFRRNTKNVFTSGRYPARAGQKKENQPKNKQ